MVLNKELNDAVHSREIYAAVEKSDWWQRIKVCRTSRQDTVVEESVGQSWKVDHHGYNHDAARDEMCRI